MAVEKFSVSLDPNLGRALRAAADADDVNVSAWIADAIRTKLRHDALGDALDEILAEQGWTRKELLAESRPPRARRRSA